MTFDFNNFTPEQFDEHIEKSIPRYSDLTERIIKYSEYFIRNGTNVYDLGCSSGALLKRMYNKAFNCVTYYGIDQSEMIPKTLSQQFPFVFRNEDLFGTYITDASFITSVFTLQFLDETTRADVLRNVNNNLLTGGAFLVCEKIRSQGAQFQDMHNSVYYEAKSKNFVCSEIINKEISLRSNMRIKTMNQLMRELNPIGQCEIIWKNFNFVAVLVIKD